MPYTAPLKTSPFAQHFEHSELTPQSCPSSPTAVTSPPPRQHLPRSYSSTSYFRRHRRSPSNSKVFVFPGPDSHSKVDHAIDTHASIRKSPPPVSDAVIPPGALISPPESAPNSSDEELSYRSQDGLQLEKLEAAVRSIEQRRVSSPERHPLEVQPSSSMASLAGGPVRPPRPPLSREARKISHSRSATETSIDRKHEEALTSSPEESDRDDEPQAKHPMVRKKSGELVRPALRPPSARRRPSSMPGTPTFSKAVHFDAQLEHIRHFLQLDRPQAVSTDTSPVDDYNEAGEFPFKKGHVDTPSFEWELGLANFPRDISSRTTQRVRLERLFLSSDKNTMIGVVGVANLAFHKHVAARFTLDHWKTVSEVSAEYSDDGRQKHPHDGYDRFSFNIKLDDQTNLEKKTMFVCVRYNVGGQEFWDNNNSQNYQINFIRTPKAKPGSSAPPPAKPRTSLPRSRSFVGSNNRPHSMPPSFDAFSEMDKYISFGSPPKNTKTKPLGDDDPHDVETVAPIRRDKQGHQIFGNRYDFEASLSAAMQTKPTHDRTTLTARAKSTTPSRGNHGQSLDKKTSLKVENAPAAGKGSPQTGPSNHQKPSTLVSGKPHRESSVYKELVDKYCFFGSANFSTGADGPPTATRDFGSRSGSNSSSSSVSPCSSPRMSPRTEAVFGSDSRNPSAAPSSSNHNGYPYLPNNFLNETKTPAIIQG
ncbi:protein phosphatase regulatory subunit Gac1 [Aspergillus ellipticus CBS 707.79]|uniref:Protein phosphatase regulatory subunit Gac1 n=1 Tax=Aspergillus ellipticus CBS 707.79 TaxID=1448320 RepID=A0A319DMC1_9EURO|nr:protein phosphatase regulatory subunit Gac1 [Aspergillus ellipticus CBS 707.79]